MEKSEIKELIIKSFDENKNSHAFLFVTNNLNKCLDDVLEIIRVINCKKDKNPNCDCKVCNTIRSNTNPDLLNVFPDGKEIKKDQILDIMNIFSTKPSVNKYSCYIINEAEKLNNSSANKILKFLEEPEENIIGFYITNNLSGIIPTIKSRCEIYNYNFDVNNIYDMFGICEEDFNKYYDYSLSLINKLNENKKYLLMMEAKELGKKERFEIDIILNFIKKIYVVKYENITKKLYEDMESIKNICNSISTNDLKIIVNRINLLDNIINEFKLNVNKELYINKLFLSWE